MTADTCKWCGLIHKGMCPRVKSIEYDTDGITVRRVEFHAPLKITTDGEKMTADPSAALATNRDRRVALADAHNLIGAWPISHAQKNCRCPAHLAAQHIEALAAANAELEARLAEANEIIRFYGFCAEEDEDGGERARRYLYARASAGEKDKTP